MLPRLRVVLMPWPQYWRFPSHMNWTATSADAVQWTAEQTQLRSTWQHTSVVLYKSHEYDEELLFLCKHFLVLTTSVDNIASVIASACSAKWFDCSLGEDVANDVANWLETVLVDHDSWQRVATLNLPKLSLRSGFSLTATCSVVALALEVPHSSQKCLPDYAWLATLSVEQNVLIPHQQSVDLSTARLIWYFTLRAARERQLHHVIRAGTIGH